MNCQNCGQPLENGFSFCPNCGAMKENNAAQTLSGDSPSALLALAGFFFPIIGLVIYLVYKEQAPKTARSAGKGALIGFALRAILVALIIILYITLIVNSFQHIL